MFITPCRLGLTPLDVALRLGDTPGLAWLDGGLAHGQEGRFSFVGCAPIETVERRFGDPNPLEALDALRRATETEEEPGLPQAQYGFSAEDVPSWIGHIAYDAALSPGDGDAKLSRPAGPPSLRFARYGALFMFDHERGAAFLVGDDEAQCVALEARLTDPQAVSNAQESLAFRLSELRASDPIRHNEIVRRAQLRIVAGDVYEVNLARSYRATFAGSPLALFLRMREQSPVPFGYFTRASDHSVLGRSMERFLRFRTRDRALWTSPIKGTIADRGDHSAEAWALRTDPKELAEHAMVVDLMRNDLSRVSRAGSVRIRELMRVLPFAGLSHLVSSIEGSARPDLSLAQIVAGTFPPGSVTGAPKESAMRIIASLEESARGIYTGATGFIDRRGGFSLAVAIRTAVIHGGVATYFAGGGIVIDSNPDAETRETELKAQVFLRTFDLSSRES